MQKDALSGMIGRIHQAGSPIGFVEMIGPVGGAHYLVRDHGQTEMRIMTLEELRSYRFFSSPHEAGLPVPEAPPFTQDL